MNEPPRNMRPTASLKIVVSSVSLTVVDSRDSML